METNTEYPFTKQQFDALRDDQKSALNAVAEYLTGTPLPQDLTDEELSSTFNLMKPADGCVPKEEVDEEVGRSVRKKFCAIYEIGMELAEQELKRQGKRDLEDFSFCIVIDPSYEDATHIAIVDFKKPRCYLHEWHKAWNVHFKSLGELADEVLRVRFLLIQQVLSHPIKQEIFVVLEGGLVREVIGIPEGSQVVVLDYDVEGADEETLEISPIDGEPCHMTSF